MNSAVLGSVRGLRFIGVAICVETAVAYSLLFMDMGANATPGRKGEADVRVERIRWWNAHARRALFRSDALVVSLIAAIAVAFGASGAAAQGAPDAVD